MRPIALLAATVLALSACSSKASDSAPAPARSTPALHPVSGLTVVPLTVTHAGQRRLFRVEVAATGLEQIKGLMFRTEMGADEGMIFPMNPPRMASFWMRNTVIPLDIIFIGTDGRILNIEAGVPYSEAHVEAVGPVKAVLELNAGRAEQLGFIPGDKVEW